MSELAMSKIHRFMEGDVVEFILADGTKHEGTVIGFANDEMTHLTVQVDDTSYDVTEDEVRRVS